MAEKNFVSNDAKEQILAFFESCSDELDLNDEAVKKLCEHLVSLGVSCSSDLCDVTKDDVPKAVLSLKQRKKVFDIIKNKVSPKPCTHFEDEDPNAQARTFLQYCDLSSESRIELGDFLEDELDITTVEQLRENSNDIKSCDIDLDISVVEKNRFIRMIKEQLLGQVSTSSSNSVKSVANPGSSPAVEREELISVRYVHFNNPKGEPEIGEIENLSLKSCTMLDLIVLIIKKEGVDTKSFSVELYLANGYPLNINNFTSTMVLQKWKVKSNDLFYVFTKRKNQPGDVTLKSLSSVDHEEGNVEIEVLTQLHGNWKVWFNSAKDSPEDLCKKVYNATKVQTTHMALFHRDSKTGLVKEINVNTTLRSGDVVKMVLRDPAEESRKYVTNYGKATLNMVSPQSDRGISAFYSILRFICVMQRSTIDFSKFLSLLLDVTKCPPLIYSMKVLYEDSGCSLPCWVAIVEGFFSVFKRWLSFTKGAVKDEEIFEFSDYFWGSLLKLFETKELKGELSGAAFETSRKSLVCLISDVKVLTPVQVSKEIFDKFYPQIYEDLDKKKEISCSKDFLICDRQSVMELGVTEEPVVDEETADLLMRNPCKSSQEVHVWDSHLPFVVSDVVSECPYKEWTDLTSCLSALQISLPNHLLGMGSLTFIEKGRLVLYMGFSKDNDNGQTMYDPLEKDFIRKKKSVLEEIANANEGKNVTSRDLTEVIPDALRLGVDLDSVRPKALTFQQYDNWKPKEAIMVLVDTSGSMKNTMYGDKELSRLKVAKHYFGAFRLRTQAYDLSNAIGLISFNSYVTEELSIQRCSDNFEKALDDLKCSLRTALHDAMKRAADLLVQYCHEEKLVRRILCLTDGDDLASDPNFRSHEVIAAYLQDKNIIVDTVLIGPPNERQKAISHSTGGACFMPTSLEAGLQLFEMETFLSYRFRKVDSSSKRTFEQCRNLPMDKGTLKCNLFSYPKTHHVEKADPGKELSRNQSETLIRRVIREINGFKHSPLPFADVFPSEKDVTFWLVLMKGPEYTPYSRGVFLLQVTFPENYPSQPPNVRFHDYTPVYHCNINSNGRICHSILSRSYSSRFSMQDILASLYHLLLCPEEDDPLDSVIGDEIRFSRDKYFEKAKQYTKEKAIPIEDFARVKLELSGEKKATAPSYFGKKLL